MTKHKPTTPLPWRVCRMEGGRRLALVNSMGGLITYFDTIGEDRAAYIAHAANAYPKLVQALRETSARLRGAAHDARQGVSQRSGNPIEVYSERAEEWEREAIAADALLSDLGEAS